MLLPCWGLLVLDMLAHVIDCVVVVHLQQKEFLTLGLQYLCALHQPKMITVFLSSFVMLNYTQYLCVKYAEIFHEPKASEITHT